jgi:hypothetical protein
LLVPIAAPRFSKIWTCRDPVEPAEFIGLFGPCLDHRVYRVELHVAERQIVSWRVTDNATDAPLRLGDEQPFMITPPCRVEWQQRREVVVEDMGGVVDGRACASDAGISRTE